MGRSIVALKLANVLLELHIRSIWQRRVWLDEEYSPDACSSPKAISFLWPP